MIAAVAREIRRRERAGAVDVGVGEDVAEEVAGAVEFPEI